MPEHTPYVDHVPNGFNLDRLGLGRLSQCLKQEVGGEWLAHGGPLTDHSHCQC